ncbi:MAG: pyridoxine 5'-phosphate synthase [Candidatus Electrothrix sp. GW3-4]|uniref:pyridoxine 5'-phosphate synthase n=1 Tax=Candidatus Electrothrix sp. GW3-4 TaxID=3126740 RepID=UPI0030CFDD23
MPGHPVHPPVHIVFQFLKQEQRPAIHLHEGLLRSQVLMLLEEIDRPASSVSIVFMDDPAMTAYNQQYRSKPGPTNVLSFPAAEGLDELEGLLPEGLAADELGDILISVETAQREAREKDISLHQRLTELLIHGLLHLIGYDHEISDQEAERMFSRERSLFCAIHHHQPWRKKMPKLAINVDHIATIRQARGGTEPDPVHAAGICELAGAQGIVVHLREDRRHIQDRDVRLLRQTVKTRLNLEMANVKEIVEIALELRPDMITLVPEKRQELTTEGGLDVIGNAKKLRKTIKRMKEAGIPVSLFIDPDTEQIEASQALGATYVELHTGRYCDAETEKERDKEFRLIEQAAEQAFEAGLRVNAGHGLDYRTTTRIAAIPFLEELSIGHAVIARAAFVGLDQAVREMQACIDRAGR